MSSSRVFASAWSDVDWSEPGSRSIASTAITNACFIKWNSGSLNFSKALPGHCLILNLRIAPLTVVPEVSTDFR
jgi:hypothetical protein